MQTSPLRPQALDASGGPRRALNPILLVVLRLLLLSLFISILPKPLKPSLLQYQTYWDLFMLSGLLGSIAMLLKGYALHNLPADHR